IFALVRRCKAVWLTPKWLSDRLRPKRTLENRMVARRRLIGPLCAVVILFSATAQGAEPRPDRNYRRQQFLARRSLQSRTGRRAANRGGRRCTRRSQSTGQQSRSFSLFFHLTLIVL